MFNGIGSLYEFRMLRRRAGRPAFLTLFIPVALALLALLASCHNSRVAPGTTPVYYSDSRAVALLPTSAMTLNLDMPQFMRGEFQKPDGSTDSFEAETWVRANDSVLSITFFTGFGTTLGEISYVGDSVKAESSVMDVAKLKTEYVLADFQVCFYPFNVLKKNFEQAGFSFTEERSGESDFVRKLAENGVTILTARKTGSEITLLNELRHYSYHITLGESN